DQESTDGSAYKMRTVYRRYRQRLRVKDEDESTDSQEARRSEGAGRRHSYQILAPSVDPNLGLALVLGDDDKTCSAPYSETAMVIDSIRRCKKGQLVLYFGALKNAWEMLDPMPEPRNYHTASLVGDEVFIVGGCDPGRTLCDEMVASDSVFCFSTGQKSWTEKARLPESRAFHGAAVVGDQVYVVGGRDQNGSYLDTVAVYSPILNAWSVVLKLPVALMGAAVVEHQGRIWVLGGVAFEKNTESANCAKERLLDDVFIVDTRLRRCSKGPSLPFPRAFGAGAVCASQIWLCGGLTPSESGKLVSTSNIHVLEDAVLVSREETPARLAATPTCGLPYRTLGCLSMSQKRSIADFFSTSSKRAKQKGVPPPELSASTTEDSETLQEQENSQCSVSIPLEETVYSIASDDACPSSSMHMDSESDELSASCAARDEADSATEFTASDLDVDHAGQLDISKFKTEKPTQPILNPFPSKKYGKLSRSFNSDWYRLFPWLEYSAQADEAFCYPCRMFSTGANEKSAFVNGGYSKWKKALEKDAGFRKHENSLAHKTCQASWVSYTQMKTRGQSKSVATHLSDAYSREVQENRLYIARVADILRFTAVQGIAQRGHDEGATSENKGNFVELLNLFAKYDNIVGKKLKGGAANAKYVHRSIQDQILEILSHITLTSIKEEMKAPSASHLSSMKPRT
ncbi:hypothetical protein MTO96_042696, partial [Rhipicephalus appendiculatus]